MINCEKGLELSRYVYTTLGANWKYEEIINVFYYMVYFDF